MDNKLHIEPRGLGIDYYNHKLFHLLDKVYDFYTTLSDRASDFSDGSLITGRFAFNGNIYSSIGGTIESIKILSYCGRLNDVFALLRKLEDAILIDIYKNILLKNDDENLVASDIPIKEILDDSNIRTWTQATFLLMKNGDLNKIKNKIKEVDNQLGNLLNIDNIPFRQVCNDNVHYNSWSNFILNVYELHKVDRQGIKALDIIYEIICKIFAIHFSYTYIQHPEYYSTIDYISCLEEGCEPIEGSQYWVMSIVQDVFDMYIKCEYQEVADYLVSKDLMKLD